MTISIQPLSQNDKANWQTLWQGYLTFYQTTLNDEVIENTWDNLLKAEQIKGFGAYNVSSDGKNIELVGLVHIVLHPNTWNINSCCYLEDLYVSETVRGQGVGRMLIEHVYQIAKELDCHRVYWSPQEGNETARKLYDKVATKTDVIQYRYDI